MKLEYVTKERYGEEAPHIKIKGEDLFKLSKMRSTVFSARSDEFDSLDPNQDLEVFLEQFKSFIYAVVERIDLYARYRIHDETFQPESRRKLNALLAKYTNIRGVILEDVRDSSLGRRQFLNELFKKDINEIQSFLDLCISIHDLEVHVHRLWDISNYRESLFENMHYYLSKEKIDEYKKRLDDLYYQEDTEGLVKLVDEIHALTINHWASFISDTKDIKPGQPFAFIGHSTNCSTFRNGKFEQKFISCSLFTPHLTDTYRDGFGFMFGAEDIISASYRDSYTNNYADSKEQMLNSTSVPHIETPEYVLGKCMEQQIYNEKNGIEYKVYNEVVVGSFKPIGIFCFTDGSKELNKNYREAKKLHKQFPELPFVEIDLTLYKYEPSYLSTLIANIRYRIYGKYDSYGETYTQGFDLFYEEYMNLKKSGNYTEDDIVKLYQQHEAMLTELGSEDEILKQDYPIEKIRHFLLNNLYLRLNYIFSGQGQLWHYKELYEKLKRMGNYEKLEQALPGTKEFLVLMENVTLTQEMVDNINQNKEICFGDINKVLKEIYIVKKNSLEGELQAALDEQKSLELAIKAKKEQVEHKKQSDNIVFASSSYNYNREVIDSYERRINDSQEAKLSLSYEQQKLEQQKLELEEEKAAEEKRVFKKKSRIESLKMQISNIEFEIESIIHRMESHDDLIDICRDGIVETKKSFKEIYGFDFDEYPELLLWARSNIENIDVFREESNLFDLEQKLYAINERIKNISQKLEEMSLGGKYDSGITTKH